MCKPVFIGLLAEEASRISHQARPIDKNENLKAENSHDGILLGNIQSPDDDFVQECFVHFERNFDVNCDEVFAHELHSIAQDDVADQECYSCEGSVESLSDHAFSMEIEDDNGSINVQPSFTEQSSVQEAGDRSLEIPHVSGMKRSSTFGRHMLSPPQINFKQYVHCQKENPNHIRVFVQGTCPFVQKHCSDFERCRKLLASNPFESETRNCSSKRVNAMQKAFDALFGLRIRI